jgi:hypothetical protein
MRKSIFLFPATLLVHRNHPTSDPIALQDQPITRQQQCTTQNYFYSLKPVLQSAIMSLFSSIRGFFVGQRHQLVHSLPSFFVIALISTSTASFVHRNHPTFDLIAAQDQLLIGQQQCTTQKLFLRTQACHASCYHGPVFVVKWVLRLSAASAGAVSTHFLHLRPHLDLFPLGVHSATIRIAHLLCPILFSHDLAPSFGDS